MPSSMPHEQSEYHPPVEEYLEAIHTLAEEGIEVIQARIAERVGRSAPSVSEMLGRLEDEGYISRSGRRLALTSEGEAVARRVVRKHRLAERLLVDVIGLEWHKAHMEAGRWEHVISDDVEKKLVALLGDPATCPHGNPIPGAATKPSQVAMKRLTDAIEGNVIRLERVTEEVEIDADSMELLGAQGFVTGTVATLLSRTPEGDTTLSVEGRTVELPSRIGANLYVTIEQSEAPAA